MCFDERLLKKQIHPKETPKQVDYRKKCPRCEEVVDPKDSYCPVCGLDLERFIVCPNCNCVYDAEYECPDCGMVLKVDKIALVNCEIFDKYLETFREY